MENISILHMIDLRGYLESYVLSLSDVEFLNSIKNLSGKEFCDKISEKFSFEHNNSFATEKEYEIFLYKALVNRKQSSGSKIVEKTIDNKHSGENKITKKINTNNGTQEPMSDFPEHVKKRIADQLVLIGKLKSSLADTSNIEKYVDHLKSIPWSKFSEIEKDISKVRDNLDSKLFGLFKVKQKILNYLSAMIRTNNSESTVLALIGPPGVGKSTIAEEIATSMNRKFVRISLGGVSDLSVLKGHRRSYANSMCGKIISSIIESGVMNPVILLDEIDKLTIGKEGDPSSALLEILDPNHCKSFVDDYTDIGIDLSKVLFICTANSYNMQQALLDRMNVISIKSYSREEKKNIADNFLIPKNLKSCGLLSDEVKLEEGIIDRLISEATEEAGVRELNNRLRDIFSSAVYKIDSKDCNLPLCINEDFIVNSGIVFKDKNNFCQEPKIGCFYGLYWNGYGGGVLPLEVVKYEGKGDVICTGSVQTVMLESVKLAKSLSKVRSPKLGLTKDSFEKYDIHISVGDLSTPKEGPSATIALFLTIASALSDKKLRNDFSVTGEVSLTGKLLPIGGLDEKLNSSLREGIVNVIIPKSNEKDLLNLDKSILSKLNIYKLENIDQVIDLVFA
ncbi:MAG: AAA family ATPase [Rickettsiales bacterium]|nr:MAG: AAA family ATPase [Rickettsiales bacterium]